MKSDGTSQIDQDLYNQWVKSKYWENKIILSQSFRTKWQKSMSSLQP